MNAVDSARPMSANRFRSRYGPWAVVTGASDGIGRAIAGELARRGVNVVLAARSRARLDAIAREMRDATGVETLVVAADLADAAGTSALADATSRLDVGLVVLAAGFGTTGPFTDLALAPELEMIAVNVSAVTALAHAFSPRLIRRGSGGIVLFGSIAGWQGVPGQATYSATKAYVQSFAEALHGDLRPHGIDVLSVAPGPVRTGFGARAGMTMNFATTPEVVAKAALSALGRRTTVVPGLQAKFLTASLMALPRGLRSAILAGVIRRMRNADHAGVRG
ncbi:SDR family NAD(P)-dependent oxidoreductase [Mycobacterium sp.]|uniref:SDR family NAD(P)-dependent oxidoreductase n=1 Tax=Mycobacterium sp. TaxID=1785 RepID=UPI002B6A6E51|nr:SDR family NAD(P)-dependent oxidoreductase [Mycobacterium sp.]HTY34148.1 SDR family NAD(P)-dependent oxidoreductase [Mycobacterium sp.]